MFVKSAVTYIMENSSVLLFLRFSVFIVTLQHEMCYLTKTSLRWFLILACHVTCTKAALMRTHQGYVMY